MFRPILDGYQSVADQVKQFREMGVVGLCTLDESDQVKTVTLR